jgi:serine/threonine-protein kinase
MPAETSRYKTILKLASGGMATVWIGAVKGAFGFRQLVAIKKPHAHVLEQPGIRDELMAEARLASLIQHGNVVDVRDVSLDGNEVALVMDYIEGASLQDLMVAAVKKGTRLSPRVVIRIVLDACAGLHAAHELRDERNRPIGLVHRDVSPHNILVGTDGIARVADFGVAKFSRRYLEATEAGVVKGKIAYMAPEYVRGEEIDRRFDVFAMGAVLWEGLCWTRCFRGANDAETLNRVLTWAPPAISEVVPELGTHLDEVVATALAKSASDRFSTTAALAQALEHAAMTGGVLGAHGEVSRAIGDVLGSAIEERRAIIRANLADEPSIMSIGVPMEVPAGLRPGDAPTAPPPPVREDLLTPTPGHESTVIVQETGSTPGIRVEPALAPALDVTPRRARRFEPTVRVRPNELLGAPMWLALILIGLAVVAVIGAILTVVVVLRRSDKAEATTPASASAVPALTAPARTAPPTREVPAKVVVPQPTPIEKPRPPPPPPEPEPETAPTPAPTPPPAVTPTATWKPAPAPTPKKKPPPNPYP